MHRVKTGRGGGRTRINEVREADGKRDEQKRPTHARQNLSAPTNETHSPAGVTSWATVAASETPRHLESITAATVARAFMILS